MGLMIREAMDGRKGIHLGNTRTSGRRLAHYYTPLPKIGRATRPCIAEKGKLLTTLACQRFGNGERSSPGGVFIIFCYSLPNLCVSAEQSEAKRACWLSISFPQGWNRRWNKFCCRYLHRYNGGEERICSSERI